MKIRILATLQWASRKPFQKIISILIDLVALEYLALVMEIVSRAETIEKVVDVMIISIICTTLHMMIIIRITIIIIMEDLVDTTKKEEIVDLKNQDSLATTQINVSLSI